MSKYELTHISRYPQVMEVSPHEGDLRYQCVFSVNLRTKKWITPPTYTILYQTETEYLPEFLFDISEEVGHLGFRNFFPAKSYAHCPKPKTSLFRFLAPFMLSMELLVEYNQPVYGKSDIIEAKSLEGLERACISL